MVKSLAIQRGNAASNLATIIWLLYLALANWYDIIDSSRATFVSRKKSWLKADIKFYNKKTFILIQLIKLTGK